MTTYRSEVINELVECDFISRKDARGLPGIRAVRAAFILCMKEVASQAKESADSLEMNLALLKETASTVPKKMCDSMQRAKDHVMIVGRLLESIDCLRKLGEDDRGRTIYHAVLVKLINYKNEGRAGNLYIPGLHRPFGYENLFKHFSEETQEKFIRPGMQKARQAAAVARHG